VAWRFSFKPRPQRSRRHQISGEQDCHPAGKPAGGLPRTPIRDSELALVVLIGLLALLAGCGRNAVRASEKEFLADQVMIFDDDHQEAAADDHVLGNREGSAGGAGAQGGGCGCN